MLVIGTGRFFNSECSVGEFFIKGLCVNASNVFTILLYSTELSPEMYIKKVTEPPDIS